MPMLPATTADDASPLPADDASPTAVVPPPPASKRKLRSQQRLLEFQEKKRQTQIAWWVADGKTPSIAASLVRRLERKRLNRITAARAAGEPTPMDEDGLSVDGSVCSDSTRSSGMPGHQPEAG